MSLSTSPILAAAASNDLQGVRWLVEREAIPLDMIGDWCVKTPWFVPESRGAVKNLERKRRTPTMIAALHGSLEVLGYILQAGADPNVRSEDDERFTAMHCAASGGSAMVGLQCTRHNAFCCPKDASCLAPQALVGDPTP